MTYIYGFNHLWSKYGNAYFRHGMILYRCLIVCRFSIGVPLYLTHTRLFYKVFWLSRVPASYFGGHYVTHYFGHPHDDYINIYSGSQHDLLPEKKNLFLTLQNVFLEVHRGLLPLHSAEILDFHRLHYSQTVGFPQTAI
jgi:hypothetical protein